MRFRLSDTAWSSRFQLLAAQGMVARGTNDDALQLLADYHNNLRDRDGEIRKLAIEAVALTRQQQASLADKS